MWNAAARICGAVTFLASPSPGAKWRNQSESLDHDVFQQADFARWEEMLDR